MVWSVRVSSFGALPSERWRPVIVEVGSRLGLPPHSIEKGYWVCTVLNALFSIPEMASRLTFKGGTSLAKAWRLVKRFSEDVDLVVERASLGFSGERDPEAASTKSSRKRLTEQLKAACADCVSKEISPALYDRLLSSSVPTPFELALDETDQDRQTLLVRYSSVLETTPRSYISPRVKLELGARSGDEPVMQAEVRSFIEETFPEFAEAQRTPVRTLDPRRTFLEKALLLHEEHHRPQGTVSKARLVRHLYDLHCLINAGIGLPAVHDIDLFARVLRNRQTMFGYTWMDYSSLRVESLTLVPPEPTLLAWRNDYEDFAREMIYSDPPSFGDMIDNLRQFEYSLKSRSEKERWH